MEFLSETNISCQICKLAEWAGDESVWVNPFIENCPHNNDDGQEFGHEKALACKHFFPLDRFNEIFFCKTHKTWSKINEFKMCSKSEVNPFETEVDCVLTHKFISIMHSVKQDRRR